MVSQAHQTLRNAKGLEKGAIGGDGGKEGWEIGKLVAHSGRKRR